MAQKEIDIQRSILRYLKTQGAFFWRNNNTGIYDPKLGGYRSNPYSRKGIPDILAISRYGEFIGIEVKTPRGKLSPDQILFKKQCEKRNAIYLVARSLDDVKRANIDWG